MVVAGAAVDGVGEYIIADSATAIRKNIDSIVAASAQYIGAEGYSSGDRKRHICCGVDNIVALAAIQ